MTQPYVLAFVGGNANGMLDWWTARIMAGLARRGLDHRTIHIEDPEWRAHLADVLLGGPPAFCFSFQGFGMDLVLNGTNYWSLNRIPFLSYLGDSPYHNPALHGAEGEGLYLLYGCADFLETYRHFMQGRAFATVLRYGYPENPLAHAGRWAEREHEIVYVKTGVDPALYTSEWARLPPRMRGVLHDAADTVLSGLDEPIAGIVAEAFADRCIHWGERRELFLFACSTVDRYARAIRAERMVRGLLEQDALIVGDWSHLDTEGARARFAAPIPADRLDALYAAARIVVNTSPSVRRGMHERIMAGLFARAAVVSDSTPFLAQTLVGCPSFFGLDIDDAGFPDALNQTLHRVLTDPAMEARTEDSLTVARALFGFEDFIQALLDHVELEGYRRVVQPWAFPPVRPAAPRAALPQGL